jgi:hypothetical protein
MRLVLLPLTALVLTACNTSSPSPSPEPAPEESGSLATAAEALRQLGQKDADNVAECQAVAARCAAEADAGSLFCDRIEAHCDELAAQLAEDRAELEQCLAAAAACEQNATDPAECASERAACSPADRQFQSRRGRTMQCASRAEQCLDGNASGLGGPGRRGPGRGNGGLLVDAGDAGAVECAEEDVDFVGCCHGKHGERGDAGVSGGRFGGGPFGGRPGFGHRPGDDRFDRDDADAGARVGQPRGPGRP